MSASSASQELADSVVAVLAGVSLDQAAARLGMQPEDLADAVEVYRAAGYAALRAQAGHSWYQVRIQFTHWDTAEHIAATDLAPRLQHLEDAEVVAAWWFIRKVPCWRLRLLPGPAESFADMKASVNTVLDGLVEAGLIERWWQTIYEPESAAFGGPPAIDVAHMLFHADSRYLLDHALRSTAVNEPPLGRRELSILLCSALLRGAGQDFYEQGDIWHRVAQLRPLPPEVPTEQMQEMTNDLRLLMTAGLHPTGALFGPNGPLAYAAGWITAFDVAGRALGTAATDGTLERGIRDTLAHHVIFHWNRLGLPARTQSILARAAREAILGQPNPAPDAHTAGGG
ncbi:MAG TPA: thiopeptide-type bacteriocin biosynthesis protein [Pseudonocardiaceae bacterium]|nr:thiopeptide-type bacteriocin biosynthesis protein [Pseudonocardiaceae bacterium]